MSESSSEMIEFEHMGGKNSGDISHYTVEQADIFVDCIAKGQSPTASAICAGVCRATAYNWYKQYPDFAQRWEDAKAQALDRVEDVVYQFAANGHLPAAMWWLKHHKPNVYNREMMAKLAMLNSAIASQSSKPNSNVSITIDEHGIPHVTENTQKRVVVYMPDNGRQRDKETEAIEAVVEKHADQPVMEHLY